MAMVHLVPFSSKDLIPGERVAVVLARIIHTHSRTSFRIGIS